MIVKRIKKKEKSWVIYIFFILFISSWTVDSRCFSDNKIQFSVDFHGLKKSYFLQVERMPNMESFHTRSAILNPTF